VKVKVGKLFTRSSRRGMPHSTAWKWNLSDDETDVDESTRGNALLSW